MTMSGQDRIGRSVLVFLKFAGDLQSTEKPMQHLARVFLTGTRTETNLVDMERARMKVTKVCVYHVDHDSAGKSYGVTGEIFAHMLFECICHQVTIVGGDANRLCYQKSGKQLNSSYSMSTCQFWTERMKQIKLAIAVC